MILTICNTIFMMLVREFGIGSTNKPLTDICLHYYHLSV